MLKIVIASRNVHKIREFKAMLKDVKNIDLLSLLDFPKVQLPPEEGKTFQENASLKALHTAKELNLWSIGDDSGLIVPSLGGRPGIYSARFAGQSATDADNRKKLLLEMSQLTEEDERYGYFECALTLASPEGIKKSVSAICEGYILTEERGGKGFGYDPLFIKHEYNKTFAEMEEELKNRISHRRKAVDKLIPFINALSN